MDYVLLAAAIILGLCAGMLLWAIHIINTDYDVKEEKDEGELK